MTDHPDPLDLAVDAALARKRAAERDADRLGTLLDAALAALRQGDGEGALLCLQEGLKTAQRLPTRESAPPEAPHDPATKGGKA